VGQPLGLAVGNPVNSIAYEVPIRKPISPLIQEIKHVHDDSFLLRFLPVRHLSAQSGRQAGTGPKFIAR
jgi:hypothetical protein